MRLNKACFLTTILLLAGIGQVSAQKPEVIIDPSGLGPEALDAVNKGISAVVRMADDQDSGEADRIRRKGREAVISALATRGYFAPEVTLEVGEDVGGETWDISIDPGKVSKVKSVTNNFTGSIATPRFNDRVSQLRKDWGLPVDKDFLNEQWSNAKSAMLEGVAANDFYLARMTHSQAVVNPETATVDTETTVDSGPAVTLGHTEVVGLRRVPDSLIRRYIKYTPGQRFSQEQLDTWQQQIQSTNFFRGAFVTLKKPPGDEVYTQDAVELPVAVRVSEAPARSLAGSLGIDDAVGPGAEIMYKQNVVFGQPLIMETGAAVNAKLQRAYMDFHLPPNLDGSKDSVGVMFRHSDIQDEDVMRYAVGWKRKLEFKLDAASRVDYESNWGVLAAYDSVKREGEERYRLPSMVATWDFLRRDVDNKYDPREGNLIALGLGAGVTLDKGEPFSRVGLRAQQWWPIGRRDVFTVRGEVGQVFGSSGMRIPDDFGYRTGGARSIRGYKYNDIGKSAGDAVVGDRSLAVVSVEYMRYFNDRFGMGVFIDAGDAAAAFNKMKLHVGYGVGARIKTPAGPLFLDLAYGQRDRSIRLHFSLGVAF